MHRSPERLARPVPRVRRFQELAAGVREPLTAFSRRRRVLTGLLVGSVVIGLVWRLARLLAGYPIWYDEAFLAITWMVRDFSGLFRPLEYYQVAPIGFLAIEQAMTASFGPSALSLRLVPFLASALSLLLFARFARRSLDRTSAVLAVAIFAASYYPARHGAEVKPYAIDLLLSLMTVNLAWSVLVDRDSNRHWLILGGAVAVGFWFSNPLMFVAGGVGLVLTLEGFRTQRAWLDWRVVALGVVWATSWVAMYALVARPQSAATSFYTRSITWKAAFPPMAQPWRLPVWVVDVHTGNMLAYPIGGNNFGSVGTTILVVVGCLVMRRHRRSALTLLLLSPLLFTFLASVVGRYPYGTSARTMLFMAPAFCLLAGVGTSGLIRRFVAQGWRLSAIGFVVISLIVTTVGSTVANIASPWREVGDVENRRVIRELAAKSRTGDLWIGYDGVRSLPDNDDNLMIRRWVGQTAEVRYNMLAMAPWPRPLRWMPDQVGDLPSSGKTWLIVHRTSYEAFDEAGLLALQAELKQRLGEPKVHHHNQLTALISVDAYEYSPVPVPVPVPPASSPLGESP